MPFALHQEILRPSGVEFAISLNLVGPLAISSSSDVQVLGNLVVARSNVLKVFEIRRQLASLRADLADPKDIVGARADNGVVGEVEMDTQGDGFVNVGELKARSRGEATSRPYETRLHLLREHSLHGVVTGLDKIRTISSGDDGLDRLLVSFKDAKIALLEWSEALYDLITVSIHTYERAPQFTLTDATHHKSCLRVDPGSRCAAILLPADSLAILPFFQTQAELDTLDQDNAFMRDAPYSPSFVLDVRQEVDARIKNIVDFVFLPGFSNTTIAIMYQTEQTWTGRLNEQKDTMSISIITLDHIAHNYPNIARIEGLPYDCSMLLPGPALYGGVMILTTNSILHVDQTSRVTALPLNGWASRTSNHPALSIGPGDDHKSAGVALGLMLEGARLIFVDDRCLLLILADGNVHIVTVIVDGRMISKLTIGDAIAHTSAPSALQLVSDDHLFVGSITGPALLLRTAWRQIEKSDEDVDMAAPLEEEIDIDEDLYGESAYAPRPTATGSSGALTTSDGPKTLELSYLDSLPAWGNINAFTFAINDDIDRPLPELVACTGVDGTARLTRFQSHLPTRTQRRLQGIGGNVGLWSLSIRRDNAPNALRIEHSAGVKHGDTILVATHAAPSPGLTRILGVRDSGDTQALWKTPAQTLVAGEFFQRTCIIIVTNNRIRLLNGGGKEINLLEETDITSASVCDPYVLIQRRDGTCSVYAGDTAAGSLVNSPVFSTSSCLLSSLFREDTGAWKLHGAVHSNGRDNGNISNLENILSGDSATQWLVLTRTDGTLEILSLPSFEVAFSSQELRDLGSVLFDMREGGASRAGNGDGKPNADIIKLVVAPIGQGSCRPHLTILTRANLLLVYEAIPAFVSPESNSLVLPVKFVKKLSRALPVQAASSSIPRHLVPFTTLNDSGEELFGVFGLGIKPFWLVAMRSSTVRFHPSSHNIVYALTPTSAFGSRRQFLLQSEEGLSLEEWSPNVQVESELPYHSIQTERPYSAITYDLNTQHFVTASVLHRDFAIFDEEAQPLWTPDDPNLALPRAVASGIELITPSTWEIRDGFEFPQYEHLTSLECIPLESNSTEAGYKNFVVAATIVDRGEDLSARGAVYVFEIVEVVSDEDGVREFRLKLRCRDDTKGPVTAICGMNGYLVSSMGQKIFVRAFDLDERLVGVAFLDVGVYVTSLRCVKNLLLIGDNSQGTWFVAFQEDPFKLVILSKGSQNASVSSADFFFGLDGRLSFISSGEDGVLRALEFNPNHATSDDGKKLMLRTEYHGQTEHCHSLTLARRREGDDDNDNGPEVVAAQSILLYSTLDGSITQVLALTDTTFKRLSLLQGQLIRNVQHFAGLNPRANRTVRNDTLSRPMTKGILDGALLRAFTDLGAGKQAEMTRQIGTSRAMVFRDLGAFSDPW